MALDQAAFQSWEQLRKSGWQHPTASSMELVQRVRREVMAMLVGAGGRVSDDFMRETENLPVQERDPLTDFKCRDGIHSVAAPLFNTCAFRVRLNTESILI